MTVVRIALCDVELLLHFDIFAGDTTDANYYRNSDIFLRFLHLRYRINIIDKV